MEGLVFIGCVAAITGLACGFALRVHSIAILILMVLFELVILWIVDGTPPLVLIQTWLCFIFFVEFGFLLALVSRAAFETSHRS